MQKSEKNKKQIHKRLDNFFRNIEKYLDPNKKHSITDLLKVMPEDCGRLYVSLGNDTFTNGKGPSYDQIMNRKEQNDII